MTDRDRLIELHEEAGIEWDYYVDECINEGKVPSKTYDEFHADHLLANGIIVPPCKVGDTVWINYEYSKSIIQTCPVKVYAYRIDTKKNNMRICVEGNIKISTYGGHYIHYYNGTFKWDSVGKTVFLTKEEAEEKLKEREGNER